MIDGFDWFWIEFKNHGFNNNRLSDNTCVIWIECQNLKRNIGQLVLMEYVTVNHIVYYSKEI